MNDPRSTIRPTTGLSKSHREASPEESRSPFPLEVRLATSSDRERIAVVRHDVYARELAQHPVNTHEELTDRLDAFNVMIVAARNDEICGFISVTPPGSPSFSIDKYFSPDDLPFPSHDQLYEIRLLTVVRAHRSTHTAALLLYAAYRWVASHGGTQIVAIGRREVLKTYLKCGMEKQNRTVMSGAVTYDLLLGDVAGIRRKLAAYSSLITRLKNRCQWRLPVGSDIPAACFHGGAFFEAIGDRFDDLSRGRDIINADVLDAWYEPAPAVLEKLRDFLPWLIRTSPPTQCDGLLQTIAETRGVPKNCLLPGAGSSDLIFRVLRHWLTPSSRVLILDPTYGEYVHVLENVIGCKVIRLGLHEADNYQVSVDELVSAASRDMDLVVLVNPNSPTGQHISRGDLEAAIARIPVSTRVWIDETYIEYAGTGQSLEQFTAKSQNVVICKSMSKIYALSGMRAAYLCGGANQLEVLHSLTPPWVIGLPSQVAAVEALKNHEYYQMRIEETHQLRESLSAGLQQLGWQSAPSVANFLLCRLPAEGPDTDTLLASCREKGLYLRNPTPSAPPGGRRLRIAVKDASTNERMLQIISDVLTSLAPLLREESGGQSDSGEFAIPAFQSKAENPAPPYLTQFRAR